MKRGKFDPDRELQEIEDLRSELTLAEYRTFRASIMLSDPATGRPASAPEILSIIGQAIELAEDAGWDASDFIHASRLRVFKKNRRKRARRPSYEHPPMEMRRIELDDDDAALVLRSDGVSELYEPLDPAHSRQTRQIAWSAATLAHFASDHTLMSELHQRFDQYAREHFGESH